MSDPLSRMWDSAGDQWNAWFRSGGGGSPPQEFGGLSSEDIAFKKMLYDQFNQLPGYESYTGDRYADRSPEELALLKEIQGGGIYDQASKDLGFTQQAYKDAAGYDIAQLDKDTADLMAGDSYKGVEESILNAMNRGASMSGMDLAAKGNFGNVGWGDRRDTTRSMSNRGYLEAAGDQLSKLRYGALRDARGTARGLRDDRLRAAQGYGSTALTNLGIGTDKYASQLGSFKEDRGYQDRDLDVDYKNWKAGKDFDWNKLSFGSNLFSGMPIEEKGMTQQPASGGK